MRRLYWCDNAGVPLVLSPDHALDSLTWRLSTGAPFNVQNCASFITKGRAHWLRGRRVTDVVTVVGLQLKIRVCLSDCPSLHGDNVQRRRTVSYN